jgi:hypothetical protein
MKKLIISLVFVAFAIGINAQGNVIKTNPLGLAFGNFNATYERVLGTTSSILFRGQYMYRLLGVKVNLGGVGLGYRYYITHAKKPVPGGFYVNPQASFSFGSVYDENDVATSGSTIGVGAELGYQWVWESGFVLDLGIGPMYTFVNSDEADLEVDSGFLPSATLAIGYAF